MRARVSRHCVMMAAAVGLGIFPALVHGAYVYSGGNSNWSSAWYPTPGATDTVLVTPAVPANTTNVLTLDQSATVANLTLGSTGAGTMELLLTGNRTLQAGTLTIGTAGLVTGQGLLGTYSQGTILINSGTVNANGTGITIEFPSNNGQSRNNGTLEATNGGSLQLLVSYQESIDNHGGVIQALSTANGAVSTMRLYASVNGGVIQTDSLSNITFLDQLSNLTASGNLIFSGSGCSVSNVTLSGAITQFGQSRVTIAGAVTNNGVWNQSPYDYFAVTGNQTLGGNGVVTSTNSIFEASSGTTATLSVGAQQSIQGSGTLGRDANLTLINDGTILANNVNQSFTVGAGITNHGTLAAAAGCSIVINGAFDAADGTISADGHITANGTVTGTISQVGSGTLTLVNGYSVASAVHVSGGVLELQGATNSAGGIVGGGALTLGTVSQFANLSTGALNVSTVKVNGALTIRMNSGTSTINSMSFANTTIPANDYVDITNNALVVEPVGGGKAGESTVLQNALRAGAGHTAGIFSSTLPANFALALVDNGAIAHPYMSFDGLPVDAGTLIVAPFMVGDANLDGTVDSSDLAVVLNHLGTATAAWTDGNFDGGATIDLTDLNVVLNHLGERSAMAGAVVSTPEPGSMGAVAAGAILLGRRRGKRR